MTLGFLWIMLVLKIPLIALIFLVWWAIRSKPEDARSSNEDDGGIRPKRIHPRRPFPRRPRRGPHGDPAPPPPARVRAVRARARSLEH